MLILVYTLHTSQIKIPCYYRPRIYCYFRFNVWCTFFFRLLCLYDADRCFLSVSSFYNFSLSLTLSSVCRGIFHLYLYCFFICFVFCQFHTFKSFAYPNYSILFFSARKFAITYRWFPHFCAWSSGHFYVIDIRVCKKEFVLCLYGATKNKCWCFYFSSASAYHLVSQLLLLLKHKHYFFLSIRNHRDEMH